MEIDAKKMEDELITEYEEYKKDGRCPPRLRKCVEAVMRTGKSKGSAIAICKAKMGEKEIEDKHYAKGKTVDLNDVEVFATGIWRGKNSPKNGDKYTEKDLDDIVKAHEEIGGLIKPNMHFGHDKKLKFDGNPAIGWVTDLKRKGQKLVANIKKVPKKIKELIDNGAYGRFSPEIAWDYTDSNTGKKFRKIFSGLALLGADIPACDTVKDFIDLYEMDNIEFSYENKIENLRLYTEKTQEVSEVEKEKELQETIDKLTKEKKELTEKYTKLETTDKEKANEIESLKNKSNEKEVNTKMSMWLKDGKITPAQVPYYTSIALSESLKANDEGLKIYAYTEKNEKDQDEKKQIEFKNNFDLVEKVIENNNPIDFSETTKYTKKEDKKTSGKDEDNEVDADSLEMDKKIKEYMKENKVDYREAYTRLLEEGGE